MVPKKFGESSARVQTNIVYFEVSADHPALLAASGESIDAINRHQYGNGASIYTQNGYWARKFKLETKAGMIGVNIGIPAPVAPLPFGGTKDSMHGPVKAQSGEMVSFYTEKKIVTQRYWEEP